MRIGIVTFQRTENYGAALQCRALYQYLIDKGHNVKIIDYRKTEIEKGYMIYPQIRKNIFVYMKQWIFCLLNVKALKGKAKNSSVFSKSAIEQGL